MRKGKALLAGLLLLGAGTVAQAALPVSLQLKDDLERIYDTAWPTTPPLPQPKGLRPCCAFGYDLKAELLNIPVPFYELDNVITVDGLGHHRYNDNMLLGLANLAGIGSENNGIIYTARGGFIDTAHVRDTADLTLFIFSHLQPKLGQAFTLRLKSELAKRRIVFNAFTPPDNALDRYTLAAWISARLAFQLAAWHEIAQWYGWESVPGFSEGVSAFSPEDLYSNLLGARIAVSLIRSGQTASLEMYDAAMDNALMQALTVLDAKPAQMTRFQFDMLDGHWWNSQRRVPEKYLVLHRNYDVSDARIPTPVPGEKAAPLPLSLPQRWENYSLDSLATLKLLPGKRMARLPAPKSYYTAASFSRLAAFAKKSDIAEKSR